MRIAGLLVALAACGAAQHNSAPPPDAAPRVVLLDDKAAHDAAQGFVDVLTTMAAIVESRAREHDCPDMAKDLDQLFTEAQPLFDLAHEAAQDSESAARLTSAMKAHDADVEPLVARIGKALPVCHDDAAVQAAIARMPTL